MLPDLPTAGGPQKTNRKRNSAWVRRSLIAVGIVIVLGLIALEVRSIGMPPAPATTATPPAERPNPQIGPKDAPVTIVEFGDYACSACRLWSQFGIRQRLLAKYGDKVRFVWADFPVITLESPKAAEAGRCAYDQNKFWEYQDYLYAHYQGVEVYNLKAYASAIGLDRTLFDTCLDSGARKEEVLVDFRDGMNRFIDVTPTFYVNEQQISGRASLEQISALIDPILTSAK